MAAPLAATRRVAAGFVLAGVAAAALPPCGADLPAGALARVEARQTPVERRRGILLDEAHHNLYASAASGDRSFVRLVTDEGFSVTANRAAFDSARLAATDILLVTNPNGAAAQSLAKRLGVDLSAAWTDDVAHRRTLPPYGPVFGYLVFARADGLIGDHPIMTGRDWSERVETVSTTTGGSILGPSGSVALLPLSPTALDSVRSATALPSTSIAAES